jgi:uncharacterized protein GlcG (DUF336 family)
MLTKAAAPILILAIVSGLAPCKASAQSAQKCPVSFDQLKKALKAAVKPGGGPSNGGFDNNEWAAVVLRDGTICALTFSGDKATDQWPGSRAIAAEKANTANALSLNSAALSTANLWAPSQSGGSLFGLQASNPPSQNVLYNGVAADFGTENDPMTNKQLGGVIVFGGGLALYDGSGVIGGLGVSGDTSCADHNVAWRMRQALGLDKVPMGVSPDKKDQIIYDVGPDGKSASGYGHPTCGNKEADVGRQLGSAVVPGQ